MTREQRVARILGAADAEWRRCVRDDAAHYPLITRYYRDGLEWETRYSGGAGRQWCGAFAAWCLLAAGLPRILRRGGISYRGCPTGCASTLRLDALCRQRPARRVRPADLQAGDVAVLWDGKTARLERVGSHIMLVRESVEPGSEWVRTVEGNGTGVLPDGTVGHGVVHGTRSLVIRPGKSRVIYGVRFEESDYTP